MTEILFSVFTAVFGGGASGIFGHAVKEWFDLKRLKLKHDQEMALLNKETEHLRLEIEGRERVAVIEAESDEAVASYQALQHSYKHDRPAYTGRFENLPGWAQAALVTVDIVRGLIRPLLTFSLSMGLVVIYATCDDPALTERLVLALIYLATMAVSWWFAGRPMRGGAQ